MALAARTQDEVEEYTQDIPAVCIQDGVEEYIQDAQV
jgi:hypothetical protein